MEKFIEYLKREGYEEVKNHRDLGFNSYIVMETNGASPTYIGGVMVVVLDEKVTKALCDSSNEFDITSGQNYMYSWVDISFYKE